MKLTTKVKKYHKETVHNTELRYTKVTKIIFKEKHDIQIQTIRIEKKEPEENHKKIYFQPCRWQKELIGFSKTTLLRFLTQRIYETIIDL